MRKALLIALALSLAVACVPKSALDELQVQYDECREDKKSAQAAATACEDRFDRESEQWANTEELMSQAMPRALSEFREEREEILELVPQTARAEIESYLEDFTASVGQGFSSLQRSNDQLLESNTRILSQLETAKVQLDEVGVKTTNIDTTIREGLASSREMVTTMRQDVRKIAADIQAFDQKYINDQESDDRLRLNRKERETIGKFHQDILTRVTALGLDTGMSPESEGSE